MSDHGDLTQLVLRWQELQQGSNSPSLEELCQDRPELLSEVRKRIDLLQQMEKALTQSPEGMGTDRIQPSVGDVETMGSEEQVRDVQTVSHSYRGGEDDSGNGTDNRSGQVPATIAVHGYQIVRELGRGGMGVVYEAIQPELKRTVALKMILAGGHASQSQLQRFRIEAEAVARLKHPNIVQIYEIGEQNGLPYFSLEFCEGGALNDKLDGTPWQEAEAATLMQILARGMHAAHDAGVIHRDLKPHNVLLDADGTPKITDFGLAKRLEEEEGVTKTESVMGTPSYMAPEQAKGKTKEVGPAADVYSLGAVLYELLTGRPPFKAASAWDTIAQVINNDPVPPSQLNPKVSKDLETICLKCLEKEPGKRYDSAEALAEDLERFQAGRPIEARPVGRGEKLVKWIKRNPTVASLMGLIALVLIAGTTVSTVLALLADRKAGAATLAQGEAKREAKNAKESEAKAVQRGAELKVANDKLKEEKQKLIASVARSLLRPLLSEGRSGAANSLLNAAEREALSELAKSESNDLRIQFIREAMQSPVKTRQLRLRAKEALRAAVGLSPKRRDAVEQVLLEALDQQTIPEGQRTDVALIAVELGNLSPEMAVKAAAALTQAISTTTNQFALPPLEQGLSSVAARMKPSEAAQAADSLTQAVIKTTDSRSVYHLVRSLSSVAARLEPRGAAGAAATLTQAMSKTPNTSLKLYYLSQGLGSVAAKMDPEEAAQACSRAAAALAQAMSKTTDHYSLESLSELLSLLVPWMGSEEAAQACSRAAATLTQAMSKTTDHRELVNLSRGLALVAARMEPREAAKAAAALTQAMSNTTDYRVLQFLSQELAQVAARMEPKEAAVTLTQAMSNTMNPISLRYLSQGLGSVAARLEPKEAAKAAAALTQAMSNTTDYRVLQFLSQELAQVAVRMELRKAAKVCARAAAALTQAISKAKPYGQSSLSRDLAVVAAKMDPEEAAQACSRAAATLTQAMTNTTDSRTLRLLSQGLASVAPRMESNNVAQVADTLTQAMTNTRNSYQLQYLSAGLSSIAARLEPEQAAQACAQAAATLTQAMSKTSDYAGLSSLSRGLSPVAARLDPNQAAKVCVQAATVLTQAMSKTTNRSALYDLSRGVSSLAARMEPREAAKVCAQAATVLTQAMSKTTNRSALVPLSRGLALVAARMEPKEAAKAVAALTQAVSKTTDPAQLAQLSQDFSMVLVELDNSERGQRENSITTSVASLVGINPPIGMLPLLRPALEPLRSRLNPQQMVDLLKLYTCTGQAPRLVLNQLEHHYDQQFADQWDFVQYAQKHKLELDLEGPPKITSITNSTTSKGTGQ